MALLGRDTSVTGPFPKGILLLETLRGHEALGRPYRFELGLLSKEPNLDPDDVLGQPLAVVIQLNTGKERFFHGIVTGFHKGGATQLHTRYAVELRPVLSLFDHTFDCRVFNDPAQDALSIVKSVLAKRGLGDVESGSIQDHVYRAREFCVQYRESDLNFVQRLLEEEGIYYFFKHEESKHTLVLADALTAHEAADGYASILYTAQERRVAGSEEHFWGMKVRRALSEEAQQEAAVRSQVRDARLNCQAHSHPRAGVALASPAATAGAGSTVAMGGRRSDPKPN